MGTKGTFENFWELWETLKNFWELLGTFGTFENFWELWGSLGSLALLRTFENFGGFGEL